MKKKMIILVMILLLAIIGIVVYKEVAGNNIKVKTYEFLETMGYTKSDIEDIEIKHSFINKILSYNEWRIFVEFESEDDIIFAFTYRNKQIIKQGIKSENYQLSKEEIYEYDRMYENGELKLNNNSNTTTPYIPDGMNIADKNEDKLPATEKEYNRDSKNVTIEVLKDTITNKSLEILITDNNKDQYGWGVEFRVQKKNNNKWEDLKFVSDNLAWIDIAYILDENNQLKQKLNIEKYYGELSSGIYRIVKPVYDKEYIDIYSNEFEVK